MSMPDSDRGLPLSRTATASSRAASSCGSLRLVLTSFSMRGLAFSRVCMSARINSVLMVSISLFASTLPSTWTTSESEKPRTTCAIASASRIFAKNWFPKPSPSEAPRTIPAMSTNETGAGTFFSEEKISLSLSSLLSGRFTTPMLGSMVAKG